MVRKKAAVVAPHVIVKAAAGCGKSTTIEQGVRNMRGLPVSITPSKQQLAVWEQLKLSADAKDIAFCAFNKSIATELEQRLGSLAKACTISSLGFKFVRNAFGSRIEMTEYKISRILMDMLKLDYKELWSEKWVIAGGVEKLADLCRYTLSDPTPENLDELSGHYEVDLTDGKTSFKSEIYDLVPQVLETCKNVGKVKCIDFTDMIWLPVALNLPVVLVDLLLVDEAQDLNRCQHELIKRVGKRLVLVGDSRQAIYGFAGADDKSINRLEQELTATERGCVVLPLNETRRCGKAIVREANRIVPEFYAHESNPEGSIYSAKFEAGEDDYRNRVQYGDMLLCRVNAPLVSECFKFLKAGRKANILGRDVGQGLISLIKKQKADNVVDLIGKLSTWLEEETKKENAKKFPKEHKLVNLQDKFDCIVLFSEGISEVPELIKKIDSLFSDVGKDKKAKKDYIQLSSIHKAKGLEAKSVYLLEPKGATVPHPMAKSEWQIEQEYNLRYVAVTRAIESLTYVS